jgi:hypothetical protein
VAVKGEIPDLDYPRIPVDADLGSVLEVRHELAQDFRVCGSVEQEQALVIENPSPAALGNQPVPICQ